MTPGRALEQLGVFLKSFDEDRFNVTPAEARRLRRKVEKITRGLERVDEVLERRTVVSRALR